MRDFHRILKKRNCRKNIMKTLTVRKTVKLCIHSSVGTLEAHKSESRVKTKCSIYKKGSAFGVFSDHAHDRHHPTY